MPKAFQLSSTARSLLCDGPSKPLDAETPGNLTVVALSQDRGAYGDPS